jgi:hypothetical protein
MCECKLHAIELDIVSNIHYEAPFFASILGTPQASPNHLLIDIGAEGRPRNVNGPH